MIRDGEVSAVRFLMCRFRRFFHGVYPILRTRLRRQLPLSLLVSWQQQAGSHRPSAHSYRRAFPSPEFPKFGNRLTYVSRFGGRRSVTICEIFKKKQKNQERQIFRYKSCKALGVVGVFILVGRSLFWQILSCRPPCTARFLILYIPLERQHKCLAENN